MWLKHLLPRYIGRFSQSYRPHRMTIFGVSIYFLSIICLSACLSAVCWQVTTSMRDKTLASIDQNLIDTGEFLKEFAADRKKLECLQTFARCLPVVQWIRKETKGLKNFIFEFAHYFRVQITD